jgi:hypothetical protein
MLGDARDARAGGGGAFCGGARGKSTVSRYSGLESVVEAVFIVFFVIVRRFN